jgi:hypothetical protein
MKEVFQDIMRDHIIIEEVIGAYTHYEADKTYILMKPVGFKYFFVM